MKLTHFVHVNMDGQVREEIIIGDNPHCLRSMLSRLRSRASQDSHNSSLHQISNMTNNVNNIEIFKNATCISIFISLLQAFDMNSQNL